MLGTPAKAIEGAAPNSTAYYLSGGLNPTVETVLMYAKHLGLCPSVAGNSQPMSLYDEVYDTVRKKAGGYGHEKYP